MLSRWRLPMILLEMWALRDDMELTGQGHINAFAYDSAVGKLWPTVCD